MPGTPTTSTAPPRHRGHVFFAYDLFHIFLTRSLQPEVRSSYTMAHLAERVRAELLDAIPLRARPRPP